MPPRLALTLQGRSCSGRRRSAAAGRPLRGVVRIISGGQTGADRAALDVALEQKIPCSGWCPADRRAEDGIIPNRYPLTPLANAGYRQRTRQNVLASDGTVILAFGSLTGGSKATAMFAKRFQKPLLVIDAAGFTTTGAAIAIAVFLLRHRIHTLNVAGPRASGQPKIYAFVSEALNLLLAKPRRKISRHATRSGASNKA